MSAQEAFQEAVDNLEEQDIEQQEEQQEEELSFDRPPGEDDPEDYWKGYAESKGWKADPEGVPAGMWRDYRAFVQYYDKNQDAKEYKSEVGDLKKTLSEIAKEQAELTRSMKEAHRKEIDQQRATFEAQLKEAKENMDFDSYERAQKNLNELPTTDAEVDKDFQEQQENPVIVEFRKENPELLKDGDAFNQDLNDIVEFRINKQVQEGKITNEFQLMRALERTFNEEKEKLAKPPRRAPVTREPGKPKNSKLSPNDLNPTERKFYDSFIRKGLKDEAEEFLKNLLGDQS